ncbi:MAG: hypothetical protein KGL39_12945 [Patescibacteria group bacterium]|nr:hypothetical protein [Patescibacteria group bacterium]
MGIANNEKLAKQAAEALNTQAAAKRETEREVAANEPKFQNEKVWLPNALGVNVRPFLEARQRMHRRQNEVFDDPKMLLKEPKPDCHYGWARLNQPVTVMRAAQGAYRYVKPADVKSGMAEMFTTHKGVGGDKVMYGSLVLVEITEQAWNDFYIEPEIEAVARLASHQAQLAAAVDEHSQGRAKVVTETIEERETLA